METVHHYDGLCQTGAYGRLHMDENTFLAVLYDALIALAGTDGTFHSDSGREFPSDEEKPDT